jgi:predicted DNA-binding transcriptional regulator AlpA
MMSEIRALETQRFCTTEQLAEAFGFSPHWIYKLNKRGKGPPRLKGVRPYRYDTQSREFCKWLEDMGVDLGHDRSVDIQEPNNV